MAFGDTDMGGPARGFETTRWTALLAARDGDPEARRRAVADLLGRAWKPLYVCARRRGLSSEAAKDAVQGLAARLLERDLLALPDPGKGRLRSYLRTALENHIANERERASAAKRGGGARTLSLSTPLGGGGGGEVDEATLEQAVAAAPEDPHAAFDRAWAREVMGRALARLEAELPTGGGRGAREALLAFFRADGEPPSHEAAARASGKTPSQWKAHLHRARLRFRAIVREEVAPTAGDDERDVDDEIEALLRALAP